MFNSASTSPVKNDSRVVPVILHGDDEFVPVSNREAVYIPVVEIVKLFQLFHIKVR